MKKILNLKPYSHYKPFGVEWLGDIPAHWEVRRMKQVSWIQGGFAFPADSFENEGVPVVRMNNIRRGILDLDDVVRIPEHQCKDAFALKKGDIIYGLSGSIGATGSLGNYAVVRKDDIPAQLNQRVARFRPVIGRITEGFLVRSLQTSIFYDQVLSHTTGTAQFNVSTNDISNVALALPPVEEQRRIVCYLDYADERIRRYIRSRERLIELLAEYRQAVIQHAVTRGLDPDVRLKPSGIEWLGDVPEHWRELPLKHWLGMNEAVLPETTDPNFEFRYIDIGSVGTGVLIEKPQKIRFATAPSRARRVVKNGDTIISTVRTYLKAVWFAEDTKDNFICSTGFVVLTPRQETLPKFVSYLTQNNSFIDRVTANSVGTAYPAITESRLGSFQVAVPPFPEQAAIVAYLDKATADIDAAIDRARREIELLGEYRTRLIADVVTGKVDVREAVADLPQ